LIRNYTDKDFHAVLGVINDAARAYEGVIPADRFHTPYMPEDELRHEIDAGVVFWCYEEGEEITGVMGVQNVKDVTLIRHAYVRTDKRRSGIGGKLLNHILGSIDRPVLMGTWRAASWAVRFYEKNGFRLVPGGDHARLLKTYWSIPERQVETSVVLADARWFDENSGRSGEKSLR